VGIPVVAGCADQVAQAVGNGLLQPGKASVTLGSGGQIFMPLDKPVPDERLRFHLFCHAPDDRWYWLGAMLTAGLSLRWLRDLVGLAGDDAYGRFSTQAAAVSPGADGLIFLPYLVGERSPHMDPLAKGCFVGLTVRHGQGHLARAIMEGVAFALRQILETMLELGAPPEQIFATGNGFSSLVWRQIVADVLARPLQHRTDSERTGVGAALLAGIGAGIFDGYDALEPMLPAVSVVTEPNLAHVDFYAERYQLFSQLYPALKPIMHELN
jgi:xylulokinase